METTSYRMGSRTLELGGPFLGSMREANDLLGDIEALRARMAEDGYLLLRGLHERDRVNKARRAILEHLAERDLLDPNRPLSEGVPAAGGGGLSLHGATGVVRHADVLAILESPELMDFFRSFLSGHPLTYPFKWLRAVAPGECTGAHYDTVYMGRGTPRLYSVWIPFGDVPYPQGGLAILHGSHRLASFDKLKETYGRMDVDRDLVGGWFTDDPLELVEKFGGKWLITEYHMGDVLIFTIFTMHMSLTNDTDRLRISCDVRYQRSDEPADERWIGSEPIGHYAWLKAKKLKAMQEARKEWGV